MADFDFYDEDFQASTVKTPAKKSGGRSGSGSKRRTGAKVDAATADGLARAKEAMAVGFRSPGAADRLKARGEQAFQQGRKRSLSQALKGYLDASTAKDRYRDVEVRDIVEPGRTVLQPRLMGWSPTDKVSQHLKQKVGKAAVDVLGPDMAMRLGRAVGMGPEVPDMAEFMDIMKSGNPRVITEAVKKLGKTAQDPELMRFLRMRAAAKSAGESARKEAMGVPEGMTVEEHLRMLEEGG